MSAPDIAPQPPGPNIQDITAPNIEFEDTNLSPGPGPDGRRVGDEPPGPQSGTEATPSSTRQAIVVDIKTDNVNIPNEEESESKEIDKPKPETVNKESKTEPQTMDTQRSSEKVVKIPDSVEKDSGHAKTESGTIETVPKPPQQNQTTDTPLTFNADVAREPGTKMSFHTERDKRESRQEVDRDLSKTPFSVTAERKPLHTAQTRSHSDYYSKTSSSNRYAHIASSLSQFYGFAHDPIGTEHRFPSKMQRMRRPPKLVRLATVTMSPKTKPVARGPSLYYEEPKKPKKLITWTEANEARPPLRIDMEGPGPTQYSPRNRPLNETNSPAWTFGSRCFTEKAGGSRTSWEKTWFQNPEVWTSKVDFYNDSAWPTPLHYKARPMLGPRQRTMLEAPSFTIGTRKETSLNKTGSEMEPSPADYDKDTADKITLKKGPAFSHQFRREGTVIWSSKEKVPGPGSYTPNFSYNKPHGPSFSIRSLRREKSHVLGPFSTF